MPISGQIFHELVGAEPTAQRELRQLTTETARDRLNTLRQQRQSEAAIRRAVQESQGDPTVAVKRLYEIGEVDAAGKLETHLGKLMSEKADQRKKQLETDALQWTQMTQSAQMVTPENYGQWRAMVAQTDPRLAGMLPSQYSPDSMKTFGVMMMTAKERMDAEKADLDRKSRETIATADREGRATVSSATQTSQDARAEADRLSREKIASSSGGAAGYTLNPGDVRFGPDNKQVASVAPRPTATGQGGTRNITSGDAGRISEITNSLNDLKTLRSTLEGNESTGTSAAVGAALPKFVTDLTGVGTSAKQKQAVIDRVKQVIGKALEGGVLRKEDEYKYTKILPTIGDSPAVVKSKLDGLEQALEDKRETFLSSLEDAGYNTTRFRARQETGKKKDSLGIR